MGTTANRATKPGEDASRRKKSPSRRRSRSAHANADVVLICNPRAGGRWKELARILDSEEAQHVRRIVTDSVEDIAPAISSLGREAQLVCIYGGDGTIQRILNHLSYNRRRELQLALIGGGTMNVTSRWCGMTRKPADNFRHVVESYRTGQLLFREVPLLEVRQGAERHFCFTFGMGSVVRILNEYETGRKGKLAALGVAGKSIAAAWTGYPPSFQPVIEEMEAEVIIDGGTPLGYGNYVAVFANVTGQLNPGVKPFVESPSREAFYCAAYAVTPRELALASPFLIRGWLPIDLIETVKPGSLLERVGEVLKRKNPFPTDPRYVNQRAQRLEVRTDDPVYTVDGEIINSTGEPISVTLGPRLKLVVSPTAALRTPVRLAAEVIR